MSHTQVSRPDLFGSYIKTMATYLALVKNIPYQEAKDKVTQIVEQHKQKRELIYVQATGHGQTEVVRSDLATFLTVINDKVIAPNGGIYFTTTQLPSPVSEFLNFKKKERGTVKKKQLKALADGD